jgi:putative sigma-54 modulation protein
MQIIISGRHVELTDSLRQLIDERLRRLNRFAGGVSRLEVTLSEEKKRCLVEANAVPKRGAAVHASAEATDFRTAVDRLYEKLSRQLKARREKVREHKASTESRVVAAEEAES